ncbi:MAG: carbohydrate kinase family protein [Chloroflexi bacterium]|nr:carbohydrate kinase family protein [Chloroflexota bacterium]
MKILCTGSVAYDYLMTFPGYFKNQILPEQLDSISLSFLVDTMVRQRGGVATNIAYTLALLGEKPLVLATVGQDFEDYRLWLEAKGVNTHHIKVVEGEYTASFFANTDLSNAQIASFYTGAMAHAAELSLKTLSEEKIDLVLVSPNDPAAMQKYVEECQEIGLAYLYDPSQQLARIDAQNIRCGVENAHSLFVNDYELGLLQKHTGFSIDYILRHVKLMVVTRGKDGASVYSDGREYQIPAVVPQSIADPTGVGDAFRGGFLKGMAMGFDWQTCGQMGSLAATYCLENRGTQNHCFTMEQFVRRYRQNFDDHGLLDTLL